jgi:hypothetical protein
VELDFWKQKMDNLSYIHDQLNREPLTTIHSQLEQCSSSYAPVLGKIVSDVAENLAECEDITLYLEPIR